jgi:hypothetical protein
MSTTDHIPTTPARSRRLARTVRRGSILILVVALVVLLALMGTAYLSSTQSERYTSQQTAVNTQVDLVLQGVDDQVRKAIVADLYDQSKQFPNGFRTAPNLQAIMQTGGNPPYPITDTYHNWDSDQTQLWLASRIPDLRDNTMLYGGDATNSGATNLAGWDAISWPLAPTPDAVTGGSTYQFYNPATGASALRLYTTGQVWSAGVSYTVGMVVSDGPPTNRFYYCIQNGTGYALSNTSYWTPVEGLPTAAANLTYEPKSYYRYEPTNLSAAAPHTPALRVYERAAGTALTAGSAGTPLTNNPIMAADADGDGIADAGYCLVPGGPINGITYYYAIRVVDNAAAINASTALDMTSDFATGGVRFGAGASVTGYNLSLFPSNIGLDELMFDYSLNSPGAYSAEGALIRRYWCHNSPGFDTNFSGPPYADSLVANTNTPSERYDYAYMTQGDQWYHQLARRLDNPGWTSFGAVFPGFQAFTQADGLPLASRFCLLPPEGSSDGASNGALVPLLAELQYSMVGGQKLAVPHVPYDPSLTGLGGWFDNNFNFNADLLSAGSTYTNTRALQAQIVTRNGVSNRVGGAVLPTKYQGTAADATPGSPSYVDVINPLMTPYDPPVGNPRDGQAAHAQPSGATMYTAGQWIKYQQLDGSWRVYRCVQATSDVANTPPNPRATDNTNPAFTASQYWSLESWSPTATKTSINTATFPELWRSFYNVMCDKWNTAPNTPPDSAPNTPAPPSTTSLVPPPGSTLTSAPYRSGVAMFKSPIRSLGTAGATPTAPATPPLSDIQVVQLRAALAGANALALRSIGNDVPSRNVVLYDDPSLAGKRASVAATVFGGKKQPWITKVVIVDRHGENLQPWVAVELYNPYVQVQYPTGESVPSDRNGVTFYMGSTTPPLPTPTTAPQPVYLGCRLGLLERTGGTVTVTEAKDPVAGTVTNFSGCPPIAAGKYLVLVSDQTNVPTNVTLPTNTPGGSNYFLVPALAQLVNPPSAVVTPPGTVPAPNPCELVLYRTRAATGVARNLSVAPSAAADGAYAPLQSSDAMQLYNEGNLWENVPFDQYDATNFSGVPPTPGGTMVDGTVYEYFRPTQVTPATTSVSPTTAFDYWKCVYPVAPFGQPLSTYTPGTFTAATATPPATPATVTVGTGEPMSIVPPTSPTAVPLLLGAGQDSATLSITPPTTPAAWHVIRINDTDWPSPHTQALAGGGVQNIYPIAGFPRNGDMLQVPFIGSYTLANAAIYLSTTSIPPPAITPTPPAPLLEVNSTSMDSLFAEDSQLYGVLDTGTHVGQTDDPKTGTVRTPGNLEEQVGRFCPLSATAQPIAGVTLDTDPYAWASRLFDFFTVTAPHDDYMPNADPLTYAQAYAAQTGGTSSPTNLPVPTPNTMAASSVNPPPMSPPASNTPGLSPGEANAFEDAVPVQGLVNINTASWRTLSMLPLVRYTAADNAAIAGLDGTVNVRASAAMAQLIVRYRQQHGPYKSLFDLNKVVDPSLLLSFQGATNGGLVGAGVAGDTIGFTPGTDNANVASTLMGPYNVAPTGTPETTGKLVADGRQGVLTPNDPANPYPLFSAGASAAPYGPNVPVYDDFQNKFLAMTRLSNLLTCRSDSFTCYVLVQGWKNGAVVSQRRSAFQLDRAPIGFQIDPVQGVRVPNVTPVSTPVSTGD